VKFFVFTFTPVRRQPLLNFPQKWEVYETEAENAQKLVEAVQVPDGGKVHIVEESAVTTVVSELVKRVV
jgi:hypothetical protein